MNNRERNIQKACILYKKPLEAEFNYTMYLSIKNVKSVLKKLRKINNERIKISG